MLLTHLEHITLKNEQHVPEKDEPDTTKKSKPKPATIEEQVNVPY
jgi:hypothetical protein